MLFSHWSFLDFTLCRRGHRGTGGLAPISCLNRSQLSSLCVSLCVMVFTRCGLKFVVLVFLFLCLERVCLQLGRNGCATGAVVVVAEEGFLTMSWLLCVSCWRGAVPRDVPK